MRMPILDVSVCIANQSVIRVESMLEIANTC